MVLAKALGLKSGLPDWHALFRSYFTLYTRVRPAWTSGKWSRYGFHD
jgi:hypothetical protein